ncbi:MAG: hypothetical protein R6U98_02185, partial [Pirellulaceae bacterium]
GTRLQSTTFDRKTSSFTSDTFVDLQAFHNWRSSCRLMLKQLGAFSNAWAPVLDLEQPMNNIGTVKAMIGALESIRDNVARGRFKNVDAMAAVGNSAAHNSPGLTIDHIKRFRTDMVDFLAKFSQT